MAKLGSPIQPVLAAAGGSGGPSPEDQNQNKQIQVTQSSVSSLGESITKINTTVSQLNLSVSNLGKQLQVEGLSQQQNLETEKEQQRRLVERKVRVGQENQLEQKITSALSKPIVMLQNKLNNVFGNIMGALGTLFFGWLTNQGIEALKAYTTGSTKKLEQIRNSVLKNVAAAGLIFITVKSGFNLLTRSIFGLSTRIAGLIGSILSAPFRALGSGINRALGRGPTSTRSGGGSVRGPGLVGGTISAVSAGMNLKSGEFADAAVDAAGLIPGPIGAVARGVGIVENISEMVGVRGGSGFIGSEKPDAIQKAQPNPQTNQQSKVEPSPIQPQTPKIEAPKPSPIQPQTPPQNVEAKTPVMGMDIMPYSPSEKSTNLTIEQQKPTAEIKPVESKIEQPLQKEETITAPAAKISPIEKPVQTPVEPLPEQQPNVIMAGGGSNTNSMTQPSQEPVTDVEFIPSSNPDNFYILYSQLQYNVVM